LFGFHGGGFAAVGRVCKAFLSKAATDCPAGYELEMLKALLKDYYE